MFLMYGKWHIIFFLKYILVKIELYDVLHPLPPFDSSKASSTNPSHVIPSKIMASFSIFLCIHIYYK